MSTEFKKQAQPIELPLYYIPLRSWESVQAFNSSSTNHATFELGHVGKHPAVHIQNSDRSPCQEAMRLHTSVQGYPTEQSAELLSVKLGLRRLGRGNIFEAHFSRRIRLGRYSFVWCPLRAASRHCFSRPLSQITSMPASFNFCAPSHFTKSSGSPTPIMHRLIPALISASAHGGRLDVLTEQGSSVV